MQEVHFVLNPETIAVSQEMKCGTKERELKPSEIEISQGNNHVVIDNNLLRSETLV